MVAGELSKVSSTKSLSFAEKQTSVGPNFTCPRRDNALPGKTFPSFAFEIGFPLFKEGLRRFLMVMRF
jgi:hypothetical protein